MTGYRTDILLEKHRKNGAFKGSVLFLKIFFIFLKPPVRLICNIDRTVTEQGTCPKKRRLQMNTKRLKIMVITAIVALSNLLPLSVYADDDYITGNLIGEPNHGYVVFSDGSDGWCIEEDKQHVDEAARYVRDDDMDGSHYRFAGKDFGLGGQGDETINSFHIPNIANN